ncbi:MAG: hypothetical protein R2873_06765 [Caldilineaceae bacterium]
MRYPVHPRRRQCHLLRRGARLSKATGTVNALSVAVTAADNTNYNTPSDTKQTRIDAVADLSVTKVGPTSVTVAAALSTLSPSPTTARPMRQAWWSPIRRPRR